MAFFEYDLMFWNSFLPAQERKTHEQEEDL